MIKKKVTDPVVTVSVLHSVLNSVLDKKLEEKLEEKLNEKLDEKLQGFVTRIEFKREIKTLHGRCDGLGAQIFELRQDMVKGFEHMDGRFNQILGHIDAFMKRTETNENEIKLLAKQHDDLAKYCTKKIAYPVYGRNL